MLGQFPTASACHLALKDSYERSQGAKGLDTLSPCSFNQSIYYQVVDQAA